MSKLNISRRDFLNGFALSVAAGSALSPPEWNRSDGPHVLGARQMGRISIANSDAYVNGAFDAADRAVNEQLGLS